MVRREQEKRLLWRALNTIKMILKEESFQEQWRKFSDIFRIFQIKSQHLWLEHLTYRYIMKIFQIY